MKNDKLLNFVPDALNVVPDPTKKPQPLLASGFANLTKGKDYGSIPQQINDLFKEYDMLGKTNIQLPQDAIYKYKDLVSMLRNQVNNDPALRQDTMLENNLRVNEELAKKLVLPNDY